MKQLLAMLGAMMIFIAVGQAQAASQQGACRRDIQKYCSGMSPGTDQLQSCLQTNQDLLTPSCRSNVQAAYWKNRMMGNQLALPDRNK